MGMAANMQPSYKPPKHRCDQGTAKQAGNGGTRPQAAASSASKERTRAGGPGRRSCREGCCVQAAGSRQQAAGGRRPGTRSPNSAAAHHLASANRTGARPPCMACWPGPGGSRGVGACGKAVSLGNVYCDAAREVEGDAAGRWRLGVLSMGVGGEYARVALGRLATRAPASKST